VTEPAARSTLFRQRSFLGYLGQSAGSRTATTVVGLCLVWFVYAATGSAVAVGILAVAQSLAALLATLPAGSIVDRFDRRSLLGIAHAIRGLAVAGLAVLAYLGGFQLGYLVALAVALSASTELYRSSTHAVLPDLVPADRLTDANGIDRASTSVVGALSSAGAGALILALGVAAGFSFAAGAYVAAMALAILAIPRGSPGAPAAEKSRGLGLSRMVRDLREAGRWLWGSTGLLQLSLSATAFNFLITAAFAFLVVYFVGGAHSGPLVFGGALAGLALGDVVGALAVGRTPALRSAGKVWVLGYGLSGGLMILGLGLLPNPAFVVADLVLLGAVFGFAGNVWLTSAQNLVPRAMRGRYFAIDGWLSFVSGPPAIAVGALLIARLGVLPAFTLIGALLAVAGAGFYALPRLRELDGRGPDAPELLPANPAPTTIGG